MISMTGCAHSIIKDKKRKWDITITTINSRFLDIMVHLPMRDLTLEEKVRACIKKNILRGKVDVHISWEELKYTQAKQMINKKAFIQGFKEYSQIARELGKKDMVALRDLLHVPYIWNTREQKDVDVSDKEINSVMNQAVLKLHEARKNEGARLKKKFVTYVDKIYRTFKQLERVQKSEEHEVEKKVRKKISELKKRHIKLKTDERTVEKDIVMMLFKGGYEEELVRIGSHITHLRSALNENGPVGKKIGFIIQELAREFNTLGDKLSQMNGKNLVLQGKVEVEKIREQIQNIE
ncbi:MAG: DUF1732 domain-containing protein [Elusimicrobiota bacterium]